MTRDLASREVANLKPTAPPWVRGYSFKYENGDGVSSPGCGSNREKSIEPRCNLRRRAGLQSPQFQSHLLQRQKIRPSPPVHRLLTAFGLLFSPVCIRARRNVPVVMMTASIGLCVPAARVTPVMRALGFASLVFRETVWELQFELKISATSPAMIVESWGRCRSSRCRPTAYLYIYPLAPRDFSRWPLAPIEHAGNWMPGVVDGDAPSTRPQGIFRPRRPSVPWPVRQWPDCTTSGRSFLSSRVIMRSSPSGVTPPRRLRPRVPSAAIDKNVVLDAQLPVSIAN